MPPRSPYTYLRPAARAVRSLPCSPRSGARWTEMFIWLGVALVIDGVDGTIARRLDVETRLPRWSGEILDFVVDYATYVFVPAYAHRDGGRAAATDRAGAWHRHRGDRRALFCRPADENHGRLFSRLSGACGTSWRFICSCLRPPALALRHRRHRASRQRHSPPSISFIRCGLSRWRALNLAMLVCWAVLALWALTQDLQPPGWVAAALSAIAVYFVAAGLLRRAD